MISAPFPSAQGQARFALERLRSPSDAQSDAQSEARFLGESFDVTAGPGAHELAKVLFLASELCAWVPLPTSAERRAAQLLFAACLLVVKRGSTYLPAGNVEEWLPIMSELGGTREDAQRAFELMNSGRLIPVLGGPSEFKPLLLDRERLFLQRMFACEERVAVHLQQRILGAVRTSPEALEPLLASLRESRAPLTEEQEAAVVCAASRSFAAITGGPGTGKTSIVVSMLRVLLRLGLAPESIALASPTGKAANRMRESILHALDGATSLSEEDEALRARCPTPLTLHRLLGWNPATHRFLHHGNNPIPADLVIVDEASMIDTFMADALLKALKPATRLVLLGDADQLPSVDAGSFFRDITGTKLPGVARLTKSFRMAASNPNGAAILTVARAINSGNAQVLSSRSSGLRAMGHRTLPQDLRFEGVEVFQADALGRDNVLERWHQQKLFATRALERRVRKVYHARDGLCSIAEDVDDLKALFQHFGARRILTVTREGTSTTSSDGINARLHQSTLRLLRTSSEGDGPGPGFYPGDPVMVTSNDYARDLFNGDQGMVLRVQGEERGDHHYGVVFERGGAFVVHPLEPLRRVLDLAYAITTHKSQGSEFEDVMVVLPESPMPLLTREVLYTAVTRAKQSVVLVGSVELLRIAAESPMIRHSALAQRLAVAGPQLNDLER